MILKITGKLNENIQKQEKLPCSWHTCSSSTLISVTAWWSYDSPEGAGSWYLKYRCFSWSLKERVGGFGTLVHPCAKPIHCLSTITSKIWKEPVEIPSYLVWWQQAVLCSNTGHIWPLLPSGSFMLWPALWTLAEVWGESACFHPGYQGISTCHPLAFTTWVNVEINSYNHVKQVCVINHSSNIN